MPKKQDEGLVPAAANGPIELKTKTLLILLAAALVLALISAGLYIKTKKALYTTQAQLQDAKNQLSTQGADPSAAVRQENAQILDAVGKLIVLPTDEQPTIATVTDPSKLKDQAFFANALAGDKVLIYVGAKKAILYRPSENKVIEVAPLINTPASNSTANSATNSASGNAAPNSKP